MSQLKIYLINLDRSPDRRSFMEQQLQKIEFPYERIAAVDGKELDPNKVEEYAVKKRIQEWPKLLTPNAIGCSLSHYHAYQQMIKDNVDYALIVEDDVIINEDTNQILENMLPHINKDDVYLLYFHGDKKKFSTDNAIQIYKQYTCNKAVSVWGAYSTGAYLVSKEVAQRLLNYVFPVHTTADSWGMYYRDGVIGGLWAVLPMPTSAAKFGSDIGYDWKSRFLRQVEKVNFLNTGKLIRYLKSKLRSSSQYEILNSKPEWEPVKFGDE